jgi:hypothetical protein
MLLKVSAKRKRKGLEQGCRVADSCSVSIPLQTPASSEGDDDLFRQDRWQVLRV